MKISFRVMINVGPRSETWVSAYGTAVNRKTAVLKNGEKITDATIAKWLENSLLAALKKLGGEVEG